MVHQHSHHTHETESYARAFVLGVTLNVAFLAVEATCGLLAGSLALVADAGHNLSDVLALLLAWWATVLSRREPTLRRTYGWRRSSILAALTNAVTLLVVTGGVAWEAVRRFSEPPPVDGTPMMAVAAVGVAVNGIAALLFFKGHQHDLNIRGAFLHLATDAIVSLGVVATGFAILATSLWWLDPLASLVIAVVILWGTWGLLKGALNLALDAVPQGIDMADVRSCLLELPAVIEVHDLHVWAMSTTETALTAHLVLAEMADPNQLLAEAAHELHEHFGIEHPTLQLEAGDPAYLCALAPAQVV
jgi:cobalt-zinc-cadmium efflux system protein